MCDEEKEPYLELAGKGHQLEESRKQEIEFGLGYYILEDGSKSTDAKNAHLFQRPATEKPKKAKMLGTEEIKDAFSYHKVVKANTPA